MKRFILLPIMVFILNLSIFAQIQKDILGFQLGKSTRNEVVNHFKETGNNILESDDIVSIESLDFYGESWPLVSFNFYEDKICSVQFVNVDVITPKDKLDKIWNNLNNLLSEKYTAYYGKSISTKELKLFNDGDILINLIYEVYQGAQGLLLVFYDNKLMQEKSNKTDTNK